MILIADSGSTKTDWRFIDEKKNIHQFQTSGMNPYFLNEDLLAEIIRLELKPGENMRTVEEVFFYGAGCSAKSQQETVSRALHTVFIKAKVEVNHDLLAACRSLCGNGTGIVAILGTGSNSCYYQNGKITDQVPSLGFLLGDEGSGSSIGKKLLQAFFYSELPGHIANLFDQQFHLTKEEVLEKVFKKPLPNRFLASFSPFVFKHRKEESMKKIIHDSFSEFFIHHICKYREYRNTPLHCTGSIAFYFNDVLRNVATENNVNMGKITESPIAGLTLYHLGEQ